MTWLSDIYQSAANAQRGLAPGAGIDAGTLVVGTPQYGSSLRAGTLPTSSAMSDLPAGPNVMQRTGTTSVQAPQQQAPGNFSTASPANNPVSQVGQSNASAQQAAIANAISQILARQAAAQRAAYDASVPGQTQNMINSRGVFAGGQQAAAPAASGPQQLPQLQTTQGLRPMGGV